MLTVTRYEAGLPTVTPCGPATSTLSAALFAVAEMFCPDREPALFASNSARSEGSGVVAEGHMIDGTFVADNLLAKHDENYVPRELKDMNSDQVRQAVAETK